jgi:hypothetical protein
MPIYQCAAPVGLPSRDMKARLGDRLACLSQMFATFGLNEAVECVVDVVVARLDVFVLEVDGLLRVVSDVRDIARGVVGVVQVLHLAAGPAGGRRLRAVVGDPDGIAA